jgi:hypothetical protein
VYDDAEMWTIPVAKLNSAATQQGEASVPLLDVEEYKVQGCHPAVGSDSSAASLYGSTSGRHEDQRLQVLDRHAAPGLVPHLPAHVLRHIALRARDVSVRRVAHIRLLEAGQ